MFSVTQAGRDHIPVICIVGPTASGKGTVAAAVAQRLGYRFLDWGAMYRISALAALPVSARILVGGGFLALPVYFSGLVFVSTWSAQDRRDLALGSNLIGSLVGGVASMLTMVIGFRGLTFLTLGVYLAALLALRTSGPKILTEKYSFD